MFIHKGISLSSFLGSAHKLPGLAAHPVHPSGHSWPSISPGHVSTNKGQWKELEWRQIPSVWPKQDFFPCCCCNVPLHTLCYKTSAEIQTLHSKHLKIAAGAVVLPAWISWFLFLFAALTQSKPQIPHQSSPAYSCNNKTHLGLWRFLLMMKFEPAPAYFTKTLWKSVAVILC